MYESATGLLVVGGMDEKAIDRELKRRDPNLFLDKEIWRGRLVYAVKLMGEEHEPIWEMYWHDGYGNPLPLSSAIIDRLDSLRREHAHERPGDANRRRDERLAADSDADYEDAARELLPRIGTTRSWTRVVSTPERARRNEAERRRRLLQRELHARARVRRGAR